MMKVPNIMFGFMAGYIMSRMMDDALLIDAAYETLKKSGKPKKDKKRAGAKKCLKTKGK